MTVSKQDLEPVRHSLDLDESLDLHVRRWRVRAFTSALVFLVTVLAALGLFGGGVLSDVTVTAHGQGLQYERFARSGKEIRMQALLANGADTVRLPLEYLENFKLERIVPEPASRNIDNGDILFAFNVRGDLAVRFYLLPTGAGRTSSRITVGDREFPLSQFVYP